MINLKKIIILTGSYIGLIIGSGIATGQEIMQYYAPHGYFIFVMGLFVATVLFIANIIFGYTSKKQNKPSSEIFVGKRISFIIDIYVVFFCYLSYIIMISGCSSLANQEFNLPITVGSIIMTIVVACTVSLGLKKMSNFLGSITPIMIILILVISIINLAANFNNIDINIQLINNNQIEFLQIDDNWLLAIISNTGLSIIWLSKFSTSISKTYPFKNIAISSLLFGLIIGLIYIIIGFSILSSFLEVCNLQIPNLYIAQSIWPPLGVILSLIIFFAIYTSACPLLWSSVSFFAKEKTLKYILIVIALAILGMLVSWVIPYADLLNIIFKYNGYIGFVFFILILIKFLYWIFKNKFKRNVKNIN